jgi:hypothetical protein
MVWLPLNVTQYLLAKVAVLFNIIERFVFFFRPVSHACLLKRYLIPFPMLALNRAGDPL